MENSLQYSHQSHGVPRALGTPGALQGNYTGALGAYPVLGIKKKRINKNQNLIESFGLEPFKNFRTGIYYHSVRLGGTAY